MVARRQSANAMVSKADAVRNAMSFAPAPAAQPQPQKVMFVARGIDPKMLERALQMKREAGGYNRKSYKSQSGEDELGERIWKETGLWEYQPDVWLRELPDNEMTLNVPLSKTETVRGAIPEIVNRGANDELYKLYPELKNIFAEVRNDFIDPRNSGLSGLVELGTGDVIIRQTRKKPITSKDAKTPRTDAEVDADRLNVMAHELQHVVNILDRLRSFETNSQYHLRGFETLGDVTGARQALTSEQRRQTPPMYAPYDFNFENYRELYPAANQAPNRWDKQKVQASPLITGVYGIPDRPRRSVKKPNPKLTAKY